MRVPVAASRSASSSHVASIYDSNFFFSYIHTSTSKAKNHGDGFLLLLSVDVKRGGQGFASHAAAL